jgi:predicted acyltransferase (DUF342 family)
MNDDLTVKKRLFVDLDVSMNNDLYVQKNLTVDGNFNASYSNGSIPLSAVADTDTLTADYTQNIVMDQDLTANRLFVTQDVSLNQDLYVAGNVTINKNVIVTRDLTVLDDMTVTSNFTAKNGLTVEAGIVSFPNASISANAITGLGDVTPNFAGAVTMNDDLTVGKRLFITGKSTLDNTDINGNLDVSGSIISEGLLRAKNGFTVSSGTITVPANSIPLSAVADTDTITPDYTQAITMTGGLNVQGGLVVPTGNTVSFPNGSISADAISGLGDVTPNFAGPVSMSDNLTVSGNLFVPTNNSYATIGDIKIQGGDIYAIGDHLQFNTDGAGFRIMMQKDVDIINSKLTVMNDDIEVTNGNIEVTNGNISTNQDITMRDITVAGNVSFPNGSIPLSAVSGTEAIQPDYTQAIVMTDDLTVNKRLFVNDNITMTGKFIKQW